MDQERRLCAPQPEAQSEVEKHLLSLLRKHTHSEEKFCEQLSKLDAAVATNKSFESLSGSSITSKMLRTVISELRPLCEFPLRPSIEDLSIEPALTSFGRTLEMYGQKQRHVDPNRVAYQLVYLKLGDQVLSLVKVRVFG